MFFPCDGANKAKHFENFARNKSSLPALFLDYKTTHRLRTSNMKKDHVWTDDDIIDIESGRAIINSEIINIPYGIDMP